MTSTIRRSPVRATGRNTATRSRHTFGLGIGVGMTIALAISALAFFTTRPEPSAAAAEHGGHEQTSQPKGAAPAAAVDVNVTHVGNLQLLVEATVSAPTTYDPITMGQLFAFADMVSMPMAHRVGPVAMTEQADQPGHYQGVVTVPMQGEFNITVELKQPMATTAYKRINVTTVPAG